VTWKIGTARIIPDGRRAPRRALEDDAPEREHVGAGVDVARALRLLGRHVARRAHDEADARELFGGHRVAHDAEVGVQDMGTAVQSSGAGVISGALAPSSIRLRPAAPSPSR
jgi:hypothetical protein